MTSNPAQGLAVKSTQVQELHAADGQHRLAVATADLEASVPTLGTQTHPFTACRYAPLIGYQAADGQLCGLDKD